MNNANMVLFVLYVHHFEGIWFYLLGAVWLVEPKYIRAQEKAHPTCAGYFLIVRVLCPLHILLENCKEDGDKTDSGRDTGGPAFL